MRSSSAPEMAAFAGSPAGSCAQTVNARFSGRACVGGLVELHPMLQMPQELVREASREYSESTAALYPKPGECRAFRRVAPRARRHADAAALHQKFNVANAAARSFTSVGLAIGRSCFSWMRARVRKQLQSCGSR